MIGNILAKNASTDNYNQNNTVRFQYVNGQTVDDLDSFVSPRIKAQASRSRLPIYYKPSSLRQQLNTQNEEQNTIEAQNGASNDTCDYQVPWHSTKVDFDQSHVALHTTESTEYKMSKQSSYIQPIILANSIDSSPCNSTPNLSDIQENKGDNASNDSNYNSDNSSENLVNASDEKTFFKMDTETIYACCLEYNAQHDGDLNVNVADRVNIIYDAGNEFVLVKHVKTQKCGYIPRVCILNVNKFLADLC